ncbi:MAG TPA: hypothetical protein VE872_01115 [Candidatus Bathyarchaeia archaeon]|nr:hypothetical protein [Candidatus Bathyarchaeia archaeon]
MARISMRVLALVFLGLFCLGLVSPASARQWKPSATALAQDYLTILHNRSQYEVIMLMWIAPPMVQGSADIRSALDDYILMAVAHAHLSASGVISYEAINALKAVDADGRPLTLLTGDSIPPVVAGILAGEESLFRRSLGPMGRGVQWFVFHAGNVHACTRGGLYVPYAGETYSYMTPIPGCPGA